MDYLEDGLMELANCETCITVYLPVDSQGAETMAALRAMLARMKEEDTEHLYGRLEISCSGIREEDWANNWKQYFKPFPVGKKLFIKPSWEPVTEAAEGRTVLEIDPASSFGTGQHHTTRLCLELMESEVQPSTRLLDLGCGSGILFIGGLLLGAKSAYAVDIEENATRIAQENAAENRLDPGTYTISCGNVITDDALVEKIGEGYNLITANIVADVIKANGAPVPSVSQGQRHSDPLRHYHRTGRRGTGNRHCPRLHRTGKAGGSRLVCGQASARCRRRHTLRRRQNVTFQMIAYQKGKHTAMHVSGVLSDIE